MKKLLLGIALIGLLMLILYGSLQGFGRYIYNSQSCERFNIDNIELRTGINIPDVTSTECTCENNKKISKFTIDTDKVDLDYYISKNKLTLVNELYIKENDTKNSTYKVTFNKNTAELIVDLIYKNN
ncbi:hypothetical protein [Psychroserpens luteolus]|uniref:hypothetical protein n=1 Tax=Psychroserpens luteolus TaxID=2855840 RepID=UPI001E5551C4|nr:hypothetical protein [Psychroserpens luteolus]MCD2259840.1 hypothetical protein [Psychroserpens luteolus]